MASAQLMEEELQRSVLVSGQPEVDSGPHAVASPMIEDTPHSPVLESAADHQSGEDEEMKAEYQGDQEHRDGVVESVESESAGDDEEDNNDDDGNEDEDEDGSDEDASDKESRDGSFDNEEVDGEDNIAAHSLSTRRKISSAEEDDEEDGHADDYGEGVGAVKIRPGETDDEESGGSEQSDLSDGHSDEDSDGGAAWEETAENEDEEDDDDEANAQSANCMFCKQDEDHDPSEEFETYLTCGSCGEHSHQQCARDHQALPGDKGNETWKCPDCTPSSVTAGEKHDEAIDEDGSPVHPESPSSTRGATAPKLARDLLPSQRGTIKPDSHSVFNHLVLDEDPMDGSRVLRKRKTSSAEADENIMSLRKRRRNTSDAQSHDEMNGADEATRPHSVRSLRLKISDRAGAVTVEKKTRTTLILKLKVDPAEIRRIVSRPPQGPKRRSALRAASSPQVSRPRTARATAHTSAAPIAPFAPSFSSSSLYQPYFFDKEMEEPKGKPYGGILEEAEADTSKTFPQPEDRKRFDEARQKADEEWRQRILAMQAEADIPVKKSKKTAGPASQIECIEFGGYEIDTWYAAPYPEEYSRNRVLYICEFCLKYMNSDYVAWRHKLKCPAKHPPGDEIYRHGTMSFFEVDGRKNPVYCQNLCLLAKLFLGSKTLYYDVEPFLFYVLCEFDEYGYHFVGYFSKEKRASSQNNVSCILTLPIHQRKGYGNLLIDFSYLLTRVEEKTGSPEKPLSDMGLVSYRNYWRLEVCKYFAKHVSEDKTQQTGLSIKKISEDTGMTADDVVSALEGLRFLVRDPQTGLYAFRVDLEFCKEYVAKWEAKGHVKLDEKYLTWTPYVMGRSNATNFELGPALNAIAPREEEEEEEVAKHTAPAAAVLTNGADATVFAAPTVVTNGIGHEDGEMDVDSAVLESTEPNEKTEKALPLAELDKGSSLIEGGGAQHIASNAKIADGDTASTTKGHGAADDERPSLSKDPDAAVEHNGEAEEAHWAAAYQNVPVTRFQVFPAISTRKVDRPRPIMRAPISQPVVTPRPKPRRSVGSTTARRSTASKPKSGSSTRVRKSGGTGRGPGRWPKGTKKSDYGNADSGPGLPPAWVAARIAAEAQTKRPKDDTARAARASLKNGGGDDQTQDTVQVQTPNDKDKVEKAEDAEASPSKRSPKRSPSKSAEKKTGVTGS